MMHAEEGEYHRCTQSQLKNAVENANESEKCLETDRYYLDRLQWNLVDDRKAGRRITDHNDLRQ